MKTVPGLSPRDVGNPGSMGLALIFSTATLLGVALLSTYSWAVGDRGDARIKRESFDHDPGWDRSNNRPANRGDQPETIRQDFGFAPATHGGGRVGAIGGRVQ